MSSAGLEAIFIHNRDALLRFLKAHGAGVASEDLLHDLWLRVRDAHPGPVERPLAYLYRAANNLMLDRHRSTRQAAVRDRNWSEVVMPAVAGGSEEPSGERVLIARETLAHIENALAALGSRVDRVFRRHRLDGVPQRAIAAELGISLSTVESDLRKATAALLALRAELDQGLAEVAPSSGRGDDER